MASRKQYAKWCLQLIEGEDYMVDDIFLAMREDEFVDQDDEWMDDDDEKTSRDYKKFSSPIW